MTWKRLPRLNGPITCRASPITPELSGTCAAQLRRIFSAQNQSNLLAAYRAMGFNTKAAEALYPMSLMLPPVSRFFLDPRQRDDQDLLARLAQAVPAVRTLV